MKLGKLLYFNVTSMQTQSTRETLKAKFLPHSNAFHSQARKRQVTEEYSHELGNLIQSDSISLMFFKQSKLLFSVSLSMSEYRANEDAIVSNDFSRKTQASVQLSSQL